MRARQTRTHQQVAMLRRIVSVMQASRATTPEGVWHVPLALVRKPVTSDTQTVKGVLVRRVHQGRGKTSQAIQIALRA